jgi:hypothetical protein
MSTMDVQVDCFGNPDCDFSDSDDSEDSEDREDIEVNKSVKKCNQPIDDKNHYKLKDLPGMCAIFVITYGPVSATLNYTLNIKKSELVNFVGELKNNGLCCLCMFPGSNQEASIATNNGITTFGLSGAGGDSPTDIEISVPNAACIEAFERLL